MPPEAEQAPEEVQDTPINDAEPGESGAAPESTDSKPAVDYQQRYESLVPEYTKGQQLLAAARGDHGPEAQMDALQRLGVEVQAEEEGEEEVDPFDDPYDNRIGKIEQELASRTEREEQTRFQKLERDYIDQTVGDLEKNLEIKLTAKEKRFVESDALANRLDDGRPNLEEAVKSVKELRDEARDGYIATKKSIKPPVGSAGEEKVDFSKMSPDEKEQWMAQDVEARMAAES